MTRQKTLTTVGYYASFVAMGISMAALGPSLPSLAKNVRAELGAISFLFTARQLGGLLGSAWGGYLYDHLRGHRVMGLMLVCMAIFTALTPVVPLFWLLVSVLFVTGTVQGVLNVGGNAMLVWVHGKKVGPLMNGLHFCYGIGTFIAPIIVAQFIARQGGLVYTYLLLAVIILPTAMLAFLPSPESPAKTAQSINGGKNDVWLIVLIALVFGCYNGAATAFSGLVTTYALEMNLANATLAAYLASVFAGSLTIGRLVAIPLAMRYSSRALLRADYLGALVSLLPMLFWPRSLAAVVITSAGLGFSLASIYPTAMSLSGQLMTLSGKVTSLFSIGSSVAAMFIPPLIGQFFEHSGPQSMTIILMIVIQIGLVVILYLDRRVTRTVPATS